MRKISSIIVVLLLCAGVTHAQMARLYTMEQGLTSTRISSSYIDDEGLLWLMGESSLSFFDGNRFHSVFDSNSAFTNRVNVIYSMKQIDKNNYLLGTGGGLYSFDAQTYKITQIDLGEPKGDNTIPGYPISTIETLPSQQRILITTSGYGSYILDYNTLTVNKKATSNFTSIVEDHYVYTTLVDSKGILWVSTSIEPIVRIDTKTHKAAPVNMAPELRDRINNGSPIVCIHENPENHNVLLGAPGVGLLIYDRKTNTVRETRNNIKTINPRDIIYTKLKDGFVCSDNCGILQYDPTTESLTPVPWKVPGLDLSVSKVHHITEDNQGNLIASLYQNGVLIVPSKVNKMTYKPVSRTSNGINSSPVSSLFCTDSTFWICTDGSGMFRSKNELQADIENVSEGLNLLQMTSVTSDADGNIWAASYGGGLQIYDRGRWVTPDYVAELSVQNILSIVTDYKTNRIYVCINGSGLYEVDINEKKTTKMDIPEIGNRWIQDALIDSKRNLWVIYAKGLCYYNLDTHKAQSVMLNDIDNAQINDIAAVGDKIFIATSQGLASYSLKTNKLSFEPINEKLAELNIMSIQPVENDIWLAMTNSVSCVSIDGKTVENYTSFPGFYTGELHRSSKALTKDGFVCFGCDNGIVAITTTKHNNLHQKISNLLITGLSVNGETVVYNPESKDNILDCSILHANEITLDHNQNTFTINFGAIEYAHSDEIDYEYMLDGYENIWHEAESNTASTYYSSVPPGKYTFRIRAKYKFCDEYTEESIAVTIRHPWYETWWAILIYLAIVALIGVYAWKEYNERRQEKAKMRQLQENEKLKEDKLRLFTSIAHELRSPLTMIISPLKQLKSSDNDHARQSIYEIMQHNCDRLLSIVKQITDVRKIDNGHLYLHFTQIDMVQYIDNLMTSFSGVAIAKNIQFFHSCDRDEINVWVDSIHFEKIIINLLSNAFKYTPEEGKVLIRTEQRSNSDGTFSDKRIDEYLYLSVYNNGSHIDERDMEHIYERFYQGTAATTIAGSGIGLNLACELVKLHHGTIAAKNTDDGVEFELQFPLGNKHLTVEELKPREADASTKVEEESNKMQIETLTSTISTEVSLEKQEESETKSKKSLLIVDDDKEICEYIRSQLEGEYKITVCFSGNKAWKQVLASRPDVVVTDLMMDDGNGYELCHNIKTNPETAHIPVIMLTAENSEQLRLQSMSADVDHFLNKPFNIDLLRGALGQVLRVREHLITKKHRNDTDQGYDEVEITSYEDKFYQKINKIIKQNIDDSNFTVEALAQEVGISRVHLNRKLKEHYGLSPNAYIRSVRLKQAAYLLVNNKVNISEVAYKVGFASHSYFSNNFHEYFGMTPTEFITYYSNEENENQLKKILE